MSAGSFAFLYCFLALALFTVSVGCLINGLWLWGAVTFAASLAASLITRWLARKANL